MCFGKWVSLVGICFWEDIKLFLRNKKVLREKCKKFQFLHTIIFWINLKVCISSHHFLCHAKPWFCSKLSPEPTPIPIPAATKITCTFPFYQLLAAASTHRNFDFPENPILRLYHNYPFAPVQSLKAVLDTNCFNHYQKHAFIELWTVPGSPEGRNPWRVFGYFLHAAKSNRKNVPFFTFRETKSTYIVP